jgi:hypothetical protein
MCAAANITLLCRFLRLHHDIKIKTQILRPPTLHLKIPRNIVTHPHI